MIGGCASSTSNPQSSNAPISTTASIASTPKDAGKSKANNYSEAFIKDYTDGCVSAIKSMKTEDEKKAACTCVLNKAQESYTVEEFVKASEELNMEKQTPPKLFEIMISCVKKLSFPTELGVWVDTCSDQQLARCAQEITGSVSYLLGSIMPWITNS